MTDIRWKQRLENFSNAYDLLHEELESESLDSFSLLESAGLIHHFEMTFELAWKSMKDFLEYSGITLETVTARSVIKEAFAAKIISDGQVWIDMLAHRNEITHTYDEAKLHEALEQLSDQYLEAIGEFRDWLQKKAEDE